MTPALLCNQPEYDFGAITASSAASLKHAFVLTNVSSRTVRIVKTRASCGCTTAEVLKNKNEIAPHESLSIDVSANWADRNGTSTAWVYLQTDESSSPTAILSVVASVVNPVVVWPRELKFEDLPPGPSPEQSLEVLAPSEQTLFHITDFQVIGPALRVRRLAQDTDTAHLTGAPGKFAVSVFAPTTRASSQGALILRTSLGTRHVVKVQFNSIGSIVSSPTSVFFDAATDPRTSAEIHIRAIGERTPHVLLRATVLAGAAEHGWIVESVLTAPDPSARSAVITLRRPPNPRGLIADTLRVQWGEDLLDVPISVIGREIHAGEAHRP